MRQARKKAKKSNVVREMKIVGSVLKKIAQGKKHFSPLQAIALRDLIKEGFVRELKNGELKLTAKGKIALRVFK